MLETYATCIVNGFQAPFFFYLKAVTHPVVSTSQILTLCRNNVLIQIESFFL